MEDEIEEEKLSFIDAIEALSSIADEGATTYPLALRVGVWEDVEEPLTVEKVQEMFSAVYEYMQKISIEKGAKRVMEGDLGIKSIMLLVGEAAEQLDRMTEIFHWKKGESVTQLGEYKQLQEFYSRKVDKKVDEGQLGKWIMGLSNSTPSEEAVRKARGRKNDKSQHVFVDLEMVKRDSEYELLLMRKEDGTRFFSPRLLRNIKLVCEFGGYQEEGQDLFSEVYDWRDVICHVAALNMLSFLNLPIRRFYHDAYKHKEQDLVGSLNKAIMALMLAAHPRNLRVNHPSADKTAVDYFMDFQNYLREGLNTRYYQKLLAYPPKHSNKIASALLFMVTQLSRALYLHLNVMRELFMKVHPLLREAREKLLPKTSSTEDSKGVFVWSRLAYDYAEILKAFRRHQNGPLGRILDSLETGRFVAFDSIMQFNLPHSWFDIYFGDKKVVNMRLASPTRQTVINKAAIYEEFKSFLRSQGRNGQETRHLLINLQDRTSWREHARCVALEQLQYADMYKENVVVTTLAVDTIFYHQSGPYETQDDAEDFFEAIQMQLKSPQGGYYFPKEVEKILFPSFIEGAIRGIHKLFFKENKFLSLLDRQSFLTLLHLFIVLKLLDSLEPTSFSLSCKDSIDLGGSLSVLLLVFLQFLTKDHLTEKEMEFIEAMIYGPSILIRERALLFEPLNRVLHALQEVEGVMETLGSHQYQEELKSTFGILFGEDFFKAKVHIPIPEVSLRIEEAA